MSTLPPEIEPRRVRAKAWFEALQTRICATLEQLEDEAPDALYPDPPGRFDMRPWTRETGVGGGTGGHLRGRLFEKAGVHSSSAIAKFSPEMAATMPGADKDPSYVSASISLIVHPRSPRVPTVHMNTRFLSTAESWFGGGADLTPMLDEQRRQDAPDALQFHAALQAACDAHHPDWHAKYKAWCDEYFYLPHRHETRGVGGIFFDRLTVGRDGSFDELFAFVQDVGEVYGRAYGAIMRQNRDLPYTAREKQWQQVRRSRYAEFNLAIDRGTRFGLETGGRTESILMSLPPQAEWHYNYPVEPGSAEAATQQWLRQGVEWAAAPDEAG